MTLRGTVAIGVLLLTAACLPRGPVVDTGPLPDGIGGTIAGTVTASGAVPVAARTVTAVDTGSGTRYRTSTAINGGYTLEVPAGTYRLEVELEDDESVGTQPDPTEVNVGDIDADRDFVLTVR